MLLFAGSGSFTLQLKLWALYSELPDSRCRAYLAPDVTLRALDPTFGAHLITWFNILLAVGCSTGPRLRYVCYGGAPDLEDPLEGIIAEWTKIVAYGLSLPFWGNYSTENGQRE